MRLSLLTEKSRKEILRAVLGLALVTLFVGCGKPDSADLPTTLNSTCANVSYVGEVATSPAQVDFILDTTSTAGLQSQITITRGVAPFGVSSTSFVGLSKTRTTTLPTDSAGQPILHIVIYEADAVPSTIDPSCTTYVFYLQPIGPFRRGTSEEQVTVLDSTAIPFDVKVKVLANVPIVTP